MDLEFCPPLTFVGQPPSPVSSSESAIKMISSPTSASTSSMPSTSCSSSVPSVEVPDVSVEPSPVLSVELLVDVSPVPQMSWNLPPPLPVTTARTCFVLTLFWMTLMRTAVTVRMLVRFSNLSRDFTFVSASSSVSRVLVAVESVEVDEPLSVEVEVPLSVEVDDPSPPPDPSSVEVDDPSPPPDPSWVEVDDPSPPPEPSSVEVNEPPSPPEPSSVEVDEPLSPPSDSLESSGSDGARFSWIDTRSSTAISERERGVLPCPVIDVPPSTLTVTIPWRVATSSEPPPTALTIPETPLRLSCPGGTSAPDEDPEEFARASAPDAVPMRITADTMAAIRCIVFFCIVITWFF